MKKAISIALFSPFLISSLAAQTMNMGTEAEKKQMEFILHKAETRGETNAGWLKARHTFTFNNYYEPDRMNFGALRVLNDDWIDKGQGFPTHPHNNMEIITIPLKGAVFHEDNMGNSGVVNAGDVQLMSAGTGIKHREINASKTEPLELFQIWVFPSQKNVKPRYQQINGILKDQQANTFKKIVAPDDPDAVFLYQNAVFTMGKIDKDKTYEYKVAFPGNGVYAMIVEGSAKINGIEVKRRDGIGIWNTDKIKMEAITDLKVLLMDVPMY